MDYIFHNAEGHQHKTEDENQWELLLYDQDKFVVIVGWVGVPAEGEVSHGIQAPFACRVVCPNRFLEYGLVDGIL